MRLSSALLLALLVTMVPSWAKARHSRTRTVVTIDTSHPLRTFVPEQVFGAGVDGHERGDIARIYTPSTLAAMRSAGLGALSYRLRTELGIEAWHWNPRGHWSNAAHQCGYWVSDATSSAPIDVCYGYRLPRRGNTIDQAANDGYSRLDDGDLTSFWKTNPYLDEHFTGESNALHPQWAVIDLGKSLPLDTARLYWGIPYATAYHLDYWDGTSDDVGENTSGSWRTFPMGQVTNGTGGDVTLSLCSRPIKARFVRLWLTASSHSAPVGSSDIRDRLGYALREMGLGITTHKGRFMDAMRHAADNSRQTLVYASSCDSWHRACDLDPRTEQPGFDMVARSGLTHGLPMLAPIGVLYDNPENAQNELTYLKARGFKLRGLELGEEADGQIIEAADYGALYAQCARALHTVDASVPLGGPSFQSVDVDYTEWPVPPAKNNWLGQVLQYLDGHGGRNQFNFCSFEWYPFDDIKRNSAQCLHEASQLLDTSLGRLHAAGLAPNFPLFITEYGYSAFGAQAEVDLPGMLFNADTVCHFLEEGGETAYLYGYEPGTVINEVAPDKRRANYAWGNNMLFLGDDNWRIRYPLPTYYGAQLMTSQWAQPNAGQHQMFATDIVSHDSSAPIRAFALHRPDGRWSVLLLNESPTTRTRVALRFVAGSIRRPIGFVDEYQYSGKQYRWKANGPNGYPVRDEAPEHLVWSRAPRTYNLPPYSLTVIRTR